MKKMHGYIILLLLLAGTSGCAYTAKIKDTSDVYNMSRLKDAPKIALADLSDNRVDTKKVGSVGALTLTSETPINIILTNRIASRLRDEGFNVEKLNDLKTVESDEEFAEMLASENGDAFLSGGLNNFFIASFDAIMEKGKGTTTFYIKILDKDGGVIFDKNYSGYAENYIGVTGQFGCEKLIEDSIQASVDELFADREFKNILARIKG